MSEAPQQQDQREVLKAEGFDNVNGITDILTNQMADIVGGDGPNVWKKEDGIDPRSPRGEEVFKAIFGDDNVRRITYKGLGGQELSDIVVRHGLGDLHRGFTQNETQGLANFGRLFAREFHEPGSVTLEDRQTARETWQRIQGRNRTPPQKK